MEGVGNDIADRVAFGKSVVEGQVALIQAQFGRVESEWKYDGSRVTETDRLVSETVKANLNERFASDGFFSEEIEAGLCPLDLHSTYAWLLDPIDGTNNFARGIPSCAISLALLEDGDPIYGYVFDFMSGKLIHGGRGFGLKVGDRAVQPYSEKPTHQSIVAAQHCGKEEGIAADVALQRKFKIRNFGSSAIQLAYVAMGWLDGVIANRVNSWDIAAGVAMLREANGRLHYFERDPFPLKEFDVRSPTFGYLAGNPAMVEAMLSTIAPDHGTAAAD